MTFYILDSNTDDINLDMTNYSTVSYNLQENTKMPSMIISSRKVNIVQPKKISVLYITFSQGCKQGPHTQINQISSRLSGIRA
jgi:hypothetical protein